MRVSSRHERGMALPVALFILMMIGLVSVSFSDTANRNYQISHRSQAPVKTFEAAYAALEVGIADLSLNGSKWRFKMPLDNPQGYKEFSPYDPENENGVPRCVSTNQFHCQRDLYPIGGGLLKNVGPEETAGSKVAATEITNQLNPLDPVEPDVELDDIGSKTIEAWYQIERLDIAPPGVGSAGADADVNPGVGGAPMRFRVTAHALREHRGITGQTSIVSIVQLPPS